MKINNQSYEQLIQAWQDYNFTKLEDIEVDNCLLPLKLLLLNKTFEAQKLLNEIDYQKLENQDKAFVLEARLFASPYLPPNLENVELSNEITSLYKRAYFANITLANEHFSKKEMVQAINAYEQVLSITPQSEKVINEIMFFCLLAENRIKAHSYEKLIMDTYDRIFSKLGIFGLSTKTRKVAVGVVLFLIALFPFYSLYFFLPLLVFFLVNMIIAKRNRNRLIGFISISYVLYLVFSMVISLLYYFA